MEAHARSHIGVERKPVEYKETIEPVTIARRLMEIREQIAEQLSADLRRMAAENQKLEQNYVDEVRAGGSEDDVVVTRVEAGPLGCSDRGWVEG